MEKWQCPTCRAPYNGGNQCYRCRTDLSTLVIIVEQAESFKTQAVRSLKEGKHKEALEAIHHSLSLRQSRESEELEALIYASQGDFEKALPYFGKANF